MAMSSSAQTSCAAPAKNHRVASVGRHSDAQVNCERRSGSCQLWMEELSRPGISEPFLVRSEVSEKPSGILHTGKARHHPDSIPGGSAPIPPQYPSRHRRGTDNNGVIYYWEP
ncbi:hypothetical protein Taro_029098, partial [Colocasia esculenta]|nr:hypothetical protein [Colocasia esculenta]